MPERMLITKVKRTDQTRADLFQKGHRYRDIICFDLAELGTAGVDYQALPIGQEVPCLFWAYYQQSDKTTEKGNPYLDLLYVEAVENGQATGGVEGDAILDALHTIHLDLRQLIALIAQTFGTNVIPDEPEPEPEDIPAQEPSRPLNEEQARRRFNNMAGPAIRAGKIDAARVNAITKSVVKVGWRDALAALEELIEPVAEPDKVT